MEDIQGEITFLKERILKKKMLTFKIFQDILNQRETKYYLIQNDLNLKLQNKIKKYKTLKNHKFNKMVIIFKMQQMKLKMMV